MIELWSPPIFIIKELKLFLCGIYNESVSCLMAYSCITINSNTKGHINQNKGYAGSENNIPPLETIEAN